MFFGFDVLGEPLDLGIFRDLDDASWHRTQGEVTCRGAEFSRVGSGINGWAAGQSGPHAAARGTIDNETPPPPSAPPSEANPAARVAFERGRGRGRGCGSFYSALHPAFGGTLRNETLGVPASRRL
jgi:hypothetical protein